MSLRSSMRLAKRYDRKPVEGAHDVVDGVCLGTYVGPHGQLRMLSSRSLTRPTDRWLLGKYCSVRCHRPCGTREHRLRKHQRVDLTCPVGLDRRVPKEAGSDWLVKPVIRS